MEILDFLQELVSPRGRPEIDIQSRDLKKSFVGERGNNARAHWDLRT